MLTNKPRSFQTKCVIETGLSDFHRMTISVLKCAFANLLLKSLITGILKNLTMKSSWIPYIILLMKSRLTSAKSLISFLKLAKMFLTNTHPEKRSIFVGTIFLSFKSHYAKNTFQKQVLKKSH